MLREWVGAFLGLFFPPRCAACGQAGAWLCPTCMQQVEWLTPPLCYHCGEPLQRGLCPRRHRHLPALDGLRSAAWHTGPLRPAVHRLKYQGQRVLARPLAELLLATWQQIQPPADLLMAVPLHPRRERERGYNQAALLAQELGQSLELPVDARSLRRVRHTPPQVGLRAEERLTNVEGAFAYHGPPLQGQAVCLIDDLCTTGATLQACAAPLRAAGAGSIWAFTVARPHWDGG